jgi:hypothetical protein
MHTRVALSVVASVVIFLAGFVLRGVVGATGARSDGDPEKVTVIYPAGQPNRTAVRLRLIPNTYANRDRPEAWVLEMGQQVLVCVPEE